MFKHLTKRTRQLLGPRVSPPPDHASISARNAHQIAVRCQRGAPIVLVTSFPRSGNTWLRWLLSDCFTQNMGIATTTELPVHPDKIIPDRYCNLICERDLSIATPALFVKTHDSFEVVSRFLSSPTASAVRHVYLYRRPEDALVSYFHFLRRYPGTDSNTHLGIDAFCLSRVDEWRQNVDSYLRRLELAPKSLFLISYERMLSHTAAVLNSVFSWLGFDVANDIIARSVANMSFENLRAREARNPIHKESYFFRTGASGGGRRELSESTLQAIWTKTSEVLIVADAASIAQG